MVSGRRQLRSRDTTIGAIGVCESREEVMGCEGSKELAKPTNKDPPEHDPRHSRTNDEESAAKNAYVQEL